MSSLIRGGHFVFMVCYSTYLAKARVGPHSPAEIGKFACQAEPQRIFANGEYPATLALLSCLLAGLIYLQGSLFGLSRKSESRSAFASGDRQARLPGGAIANLRQQRIPCYVNFHILPHSRGAFCFHGSISS
jgi:hypothetical protein